MQLMDMCLLNGFLRRTSEFLGVLDMYWIEITEFHLRLSSVPMSFAIASQGEDYLMSSHKKEGMHRSRVMNF